MKVNKGTSKDCINLDSFEVRRTSVYNDKVFCDLTINGITIYGCTVATTKDGKDFISFPQKKGKDDKYYSVVYCRLSDQDSEKILKEIEKSVNA